MSCCSAFDCNVHTPEGGSHEDCFKLVLTRVLNEYCRAHGFLQDQDENLSGSDSREGIIACVRVELLEARFEGQIPGQLGYTFIQGLVHNVVLLAP